MCHLDEIMAVSEGNVLEPCEPINLPTGFPVVFTDSNVFIRETLIGYAPYNAVLVWEVPVSRHFCHVLSPTGLELAEGKDQVHLNLLHPDKREHGSCAFLCLLVRYLPAVQRSSVSSLRFFSVKGTAKKRVHQLNTGSINHSYLYSGLITWRNAPLAFIGFGLLDADISLSVDQAGTISDLCFCHTKTL